MNTFNIISIIIICASLTWSVGVLIFAGIKRALIRKKNKKEVLSNDDENERVKEDSKN